MVQVLVTTSGSYLYMAQLKKLDGREPKQGQWAIPEFRAVNSPLVVGEWREQLRHPDKEYKEEVSSGLQDWVQVQRV